MSDAARLLLGVQARRLGLRLDRLPEAVEPAGGVERDGVVSPAVGRDQAGIEGVGPATGEGREADVLIRQVGTGRSRGSTSSRRRRATRRGRPGPGGGACRASAATGARPSPARDRRGTARSVRDVSVVIPVADVVDMILAESRRFPALPQSGGQRPDVGLQVRLRADGERRTHHAVPADGEPSGLAGPLRHDEPPGLLHRRRQPLDLDLAVVAAARVGGPQLEECGGRSTRDRGSFVAGGVHGAPWLGGSGMLLARELRRRCDRLPPPHPTTRGPDTGREAGEAFSGPTGRPPLDRQVTRCTYSGFPPWLAVPG